MADSIRYLSDDAVRWPGPTDFTDPNTPVALSDAGAYTVTVTARLYDEKASAALTVAAAATDTTLTVKDASLFTADQTVELWLDNGVLHSANIDSIDTTADTLTMDTAIPASRSAIVGSMARQKLGADITCTEYGTPVAKPSAGYLDWGYQGTLSDAHADFRPGMWVRVEVDCDGGAALRLFKSKVYSVIEDG